MNELLIKDFKAYLEESKKPKVTTYHSTYTKSIKFYEWGNLDSQPLVFEKPEQFEAFLKNSNITYTEEDKKLWTRDSCHASCKNGSPKLVIEEFLYDLRRTMEGKPKFDYSNYPRRYNPHGYNDYEDWNNWDY